MITYYYKSLRSTEMKQVPDYKHGSWVYVEAPSAQEITQLSETFKLDHGYLQDALDEDEMPRLEKEGDKTYIFVRFAYQKGNDVPITIPLLFIFSNETIITVSLVRFPFLDTFLQSKIDFNTTQRAKLVLQILQQIVEQYNIFINSTSKQIKAIRSRLRTRGISNQDLIDFVALEDGLNEFLAALEPTNATLRRLSRGRYVPLFEEDEDIIDDLLLNNEQSVEACNSNIKSIVNIREAYSSISSNNLNRSMQYLTAITVLVAVPNMFFGLYGMNVPLPSQDAAWIFGTIVTVACTVTILVFLYGRRRMF